MVRACALGLVLPLGGCLDEASLLSAAGSSGEAAVLREVSLFSGNVVVRPLRGYCIDKAATRRGSGSNFVLIASCETLTGERGVSVEPVMMTVSVLPRRARAGQPSAAEIARSVTSDQTKAQIDGDGVALVHVASGGDQVLPGGAPQHWRAGMEINGHLVGLAIYARNGSALAGARGKRMITALAESLRKASPVKK